MTMKLALVIIMSFPLAISGIMLLVAVLVNFGCWNLLSKSDVFRLFAQLIIWGICLTFYIYLIWAENNRPGFLEPSNQWIPYIIVYLFEIFWLPFLALQDDLTKPRHKGFTSKLKVITESISDWGGWWILTYIIRIIWAIIMNKLDAGFTDDVKNEIALWIALPYWTLLHPFIMLMCIVSVVAAIIKVLMIIF